MAIFSPNAEVGSHFRMSNDHKYGPPVPRDVEDSFLSYIDWEIYSAFLGITEAIGTVIWVMLVVSLLKETRLKWLSPTLRISISAIYCVVKIALLRQLWIGTVYYVICVTVMALFWVYSSQAVLFRKGPLRRLFQFQRLKDEDLWRPGRLFLWLLDWESTFSAGVTSWFEVHRWSVVRALTSRWVKETQNKNLETTAVKNEMDMRQQSQKNCVSDGSAVPENASPRRRGFHFSTSLEPAHLSLSSKQETSSKSLPWKTILGKFDISISRWNSAFIESWRATFVDYARLLLEGRSSSTRSNDDDNKQQSVRLLIKISASGLLIAVTTQSPTVSLITSIARAGECAFELVLRQFSQGDDTEEFKYFYSDYRRFGLHLSEVQREVIHHAMLQLNHCSEASKRSHSYGGDVSVLPLRAFWVKNFTTELHAEPSLTTLRMKRTVSDSGTSFGRAMETIF